MAADDNKHVTVRMPIEYLITVAAYGSLGDGKLPDIMRAWAQNECIKQGLKDELVLAQNRRLVDLSNRIEKVIGPRAMAGLTADVLDAAKVLKRVMADKDGRDG